jgi:hypothetical protein
MTHIVALAFLSTTVLACSNQAPPLAIPGRNSALGIEEFRVSETDTSLVITGLDAQKNLVAQLEVKRGRFAMSPEYAEGRVGEATNVDGRQIDIECRGIKLHHESQGYAHLQLPLPPLREYSPMKTFVADPQVASVLESRGVSFRARPNRASLAATEVPHDFREYCSGYTSHHLGLGGNCLQYSGDEPNGWSTNSCNTEGVRTVMCSDTSIEDPNYTSGFYTSLYQCCDYTDIGTTGVSAAEKTCIPEAGGISPCGVTGPFGCAECWHVNNTTSCYNWCQGEGDDCHPLKGCDGQPDIRSGIDLYWTL